MDCDNPQQKMGVETDKESSTNRAKRGPNWQADCRTHLRDASITDLNSGRLISPGKVRWLRDLTLFNQETIYYIYNTYYSVYIYILQCVYIYGHIQYFILEREREMVTPKNDGNSLSSTLWVGSAQGPKVPRLCISPDSAKALGAIACRVYEPTHNSNTTMCNVAQCGTQIYIYIYIHLSIWHRIHAGYLYSWKGWTKTHL